MPTITYDKKELKRLIGRKISNEQLEEVISLIKPNVEVSTENEITIEHTADRPDLFGIEGLARAIQDYLGISPGLEKFRVIKPKITIKVDNVPIRPYIAATVVRDVKISEEFIKNLINTQEVLHETIGRKRKKIAIGIHDFDKIFSPISYAGTTHDAKIIPLEYKKEMSLKEVLEKLPTGKDYGEIISSARLLPVFVDAKGIFSFPPIINSERTRVTEKTKNLFIEITGVEKQIVQQTLNILVTNFAERKFRVEGVRLKYEKKTDVTPNLTENVVEVNRNLVNNTLGLNLSAKEIIELLKRMGYDAVGAADKIEVIVPAYRVDILHPVDIVEDVAIAYGYNNFIPELPNLSTIGSALPLEKLCGKVRLTLVGAGFLEIMRTILSNSIEQFDKMNVPREEVIEIENPVSSEYTCMRSWLLPSLLKVLSVNKHFEYPQNIFEIGDVVLPDKNEETASKSVRKVCALICHSKANFAEIKSIIDNLLKNLEFGYSTENCLHTGYIPGRGAHIKINKKVIGSFGEIHPQALENWKLEMPVAVFEINLEELL